MLFLSRKRSRSVDRFQDASPPSPGSAPFDHEVSSSDEDLLNFHPHADAIAARKKKLAEEVAVKKAKAAVNRRVSEHKENRKSIYLFSRLPAF